MRIAIVGAGSAASICAASIFGIYRHYINTYDGPNLRNLKVTMISNPQIPTMKVGESLSPSLFRVLTSILSLKTLEDLDALEIVLRVGARHKWENAVNPTFDVNYTTHPDGLKNVAAHFSSEKLGPFVLERLNKLYDNRISCVYDDIKSIRQTENLAIAEGEYSSYTFDYIFDCRGFPSKQELDSDEYQYAPFDTVNSALLFQHEQAYNEPYTEVIFNKNGWQFGINTKNRKAYGYLYNHSVTEKEDALIHFKSMYPNLNIKDDNVKTLGWSAYSIKKPFKGRIISMGNRLYFYEPIQGIPLHYYLNFTHTVSSGLLINRIEDPLTNKIVMDSSINIEDIANNYHREMMENFYLVILSNYVGNRMDSDFWTNISEKSKKILLESSKWMEFCREYHNYKTGLRPDYPKFTPHPGNVIRQYMDGLNVPIEKFLDWKNPDA